MKQTKQRVIRLLGANGGLTTGDLSDALGISATAVRRHLKALEKENAVQYRVEQRGMGRPSYVYELVDNGPALFSQSYATFANAVLEELTELDDQRDRAKVFEQHHAPRHKRYVKMTTGESLTERVASLARLMENEGRITTWQQVGENHFILREHNCPLQSLAQRLDHPCRCEISLLKETLQARVRRICHIAEGDVACVFEIQGQENGKLEEPITVNRWIHKQNGRSVRHLAKEAAAAA